MGGKGVGICWIIGMVGVKTYWMAVVRSNGICVKNEVNYRWISWKLWL